MGIVFSELFALFLHSTCFLRGLVRKTIARKFSSANFLRPFFGEYFVNGVVVV